MRIGFDIGGVLSKYPREFHSLLEILYQSNDFDSHNLFVITDQHPLDKVMKVLEDNFNGYFNPINVFCADYDKHGNMAKALLIKELSLDIFIDDYEAYLAWDSTLGPQPILLKVMPDVFKPYWDASWKQEGGDFGRRVYTHGS